MISGRCWVEFQLDPDGLPVKEPVLIGSWDDEGEFCTEWRGSSSAMELGPDGIWRARVSLAFDREEQPFWWGLQERDQWLMFERQALRFHPGRPEERLQRFRLGNRKLFGFHREGADGFRVGVWAPHAVSVHLFGPRAEGDLRLPLRRTDEGWFGDWSHGWAEWKGQRYGFEVGTPEGDLILRADPYARRRQGPQKGVADLYVDRRGEPTHIYAQDLDGGARLLRFEAISRPAQRMPLGPVLTLYENGHRLSASELRRFLAKRLPLPKGEAWWQDQVALDGSIALKRVKGADAYSVCLGPAEALEGLEYSLVDRDGVEYHDPWDRRLDGLHNWARLGIAAEPVRIDEQYRHPTAKGAAATDLVLYEVHVGSIFGRGGNLRTSTFEDLIPALRKIRRAGFTALALMPTNSTEGVRDWGYLGTSTLAHHEPLSGSKRSAEESLVRFIEEAHRAGLKVFNDVVYNHVGGDHNDLWEFDGVGNSWFEQGLDYEPKLAASGPMARAPQDTSLAHPRTLGSTVKKTPWGPIPAFGKPEVEQFYIDHALDQFERFGFDGLRFDFTHLIHAPEGGGEAGWRMIREINARIAHFYPEAHTFAEEFPQHPIITAPVRAGGAGFGAMWDTEHQHRLIFHHHSRSVVEALVLGEPPPIQRYLEHLERPQGFSAAVHRVIVLSNHDEVGNATRLWTLVESHPRGADLARAVSWLALLGPGFPILFQGTEVLAENRFSWGLPARWDVQTGFSDPRSSRLATHQRQHFDSLKDLLAFRHRHPELNGPVEVAGTFVDVERRLFGFRRGGFWVVANLSEVTQPLPARLPVLPSALLSSERLAYGYRGARSRGARVGGLAVKVFALA